MKLILIAAISVAAQAAIQPAHLRAHVEFLASDALDGRATPSAGLIVASEYIAAQFRRAGLSPGNGESFFQEEAPGKRNVVGILRGSDPKLRDTYVLVTAHYDHVGTNPNLPGDMIHNGANDNASGVASIIEIAGDLTTRKPRRSIVFVAYFGEEGGLIGSRYYAAHPIYPIESTVAQINVEQTGRTDDNRGPRIRTLEMSGWGYSQLTDIAQRTANATGVRLNNDPKWSPAVFERSDNEALAKLGVPAHTFAVAFEFPDYHAPGDEWHKLDYDNMTLVTRALSDLTLAVANAVEPPHWYKGAPFGSIHTTMSAPVPRKQEAPAAPRGTAGASTPLTGKKSKKGARPASSAGPTSGPRPPSAPPRDRP